MNCLSKIVVAASMLISGGTGLAEAAVAKSILKEAERIESKQELFIYELSYFPFYDVHTYIKIEEISKKIFQLVQPLYHFATEKFKQIIHLTNIK